MSASAAPPADRFRPDQAPLEQYRALSRAAVLALLLGFASALVLVSPLLVMVPLAAVFTAVVALRSIAAGNGQLAGRGIATAGLCLAVLLTGWGLARHFSRQATVADQAIRLADGWLGLVRDGQLAAAHQLTLAPSRRLRSTAAVADYYRTNTQAAENMHLLFENVALAPFLARGKQATFRFDSLAFQSRTGLADEVVLKYWLDGPGGQTTPAWIIVVRAREDIHATPGWEIRRVSAELPSGISG